MQYIQADFTERTISWPFILATSRAGWWAAHDQEREGAVCVQLLPLPRHTLPSEYVCHHAANAVVPATGGNHHFLFKVLVNGYLKDSLHLAERVGLLGHLGHTCMATSCPQQHAGWQWPDPSR